MAEPTSASVTPYVAITQRQKWLLLSLFGVYVLLVAIVRQSDPTPTKDWIPVYLAAYVGVVAAPLFFLRSDLGWFHPLVFSSLLRLVDLVRRFAMFSWGVDYHIALTSSPDELSSLIEFQLFLHTIAVVSYYLGFLVGPRLPVPRLAFPTPRNLLPKLVAISVVAALAFAIYILDRGGLSAHIASWSLGRREQLSGTHYAIAIAGLGVPACWFWLAYRRNATYSLSFWAASATALTIAFLASGSRGSVVYPAIVGLIIWMMRERRVSYTRVLVGTALAFYAIAVLGTYRRSGWEGESDWGKATATPMVEAITSGAGGELQDRSTTEDGGLPVLAKVPDEVPLLYGDTYLAVLTLPVPRVFWPDKPTLVDGRAGAVFFGSRAGIPPGAVGEAFWNFHIPGVVLVFLLFGVFHRWLGRFYCRYRDRPAALVLYASALLLLREPASPSLVLWLISLVPLVGILLGIGGLSLGRTRPGGAGRQVTYHAREVPP